MYSSGQYFVHRFSISRSSVRQFPERSWTVVAFPCFTVVKSFTSWYAVILLFFRFSSILLFCSPIQFLCVCAFFFMHLLMLWFISLCFSDPSGANRFFPQFSHFVVHTKNFCGGQGSFFPLMMFAKDLTGCFSHCCVEDGDHCIQVCIFIVHDGERCKFPAYHSLEGFQHIGIFQLFEVKLESCALAC